jgi:hypothetical protein
MATAVEQNVEVRESFGLMLNYSKLCLIDGTTATLTGRYRLVRKDEYICLITFAHMNYKVQSRCHND